MTVIRRVFQFYADGFSGMSAWGRKAWIIILIKLFIIFAVLRLFFFPDFLKTRFDNDSDRSQYVRDQIINLK